MKDGLKVLIMNVLMAAIAATVWGALARFSGASWSVALAAYGVAAGVIFVALCAVCTGRAR